MLFDLGLIEYERAYVIQKELVAKRKSGSLEDSLIIAEHFPVFTIGRSGNIENLLVGLEQLKAASIPLKNIDRGGDITFHGPGQIVLYPILDLKTREKDLHKYMRGLEGVAIDFLKGYSVNAKRISGRTGVWVSDKKIASIGIAASNWVTYHGMSININVSLDYFSMIKPCGLTDVSMTSLKNILRRTVDMSEVRARLLEKFENIFHLSEGWSYGRTPGMA